jgi:hypothetical protein
MKPAHSRPHGSSYRSRGSGRVTSYPTGGCRCDRVLAMDGKIDRTSSTEALSEVMDPDRSGIPRGVLLHLQASDHVTLVEGRLEAMKQLERLDDGAFIWARKLYVTTRAGYASVQPLLAAPLNYHLATASPS